MKHTVLLTWNNVDEYFTEDVETFTGVMQVSSYQVARRILAILDAKFELGLKTIPGTDCRCENLINENYFGKDSDGKLITFNIFQS